MCAVAKAEDLSYDVRLSNNTDCEDVMVDENGVRVLCNTKDMTGNVTIHVCGGSFCKSLTTPLSESHPHPHTHTHTHTHTFILHAHIRASVDALCRDGTIQISRERVQRGRLILAREQEVEPKKHTVGIHRPTYTSSNAF